MKASLLTFGLALSLSIASSTAVQGDVFVGDREVEVLEALGQPNGSMGSQDLQVYFYDRGEVFLRDGIVESHTILSQEEAQQRRQEAARKREERLEKERKEKEERIAEGRGIRDAKVADEHFNSLSPTARLAFWKAFREKYPEVDVDLEYSVAYQEARLEKAERMAEAKRERQLHELELRVKEAEYEARRAEREAEVARKRQTSRYHDRFVHFHQRPTVVIRAKPHDKRDHSRGKYSRSHTRGERRHDHSKSKVERTEREDIRDRLRSRNPSSQPKAEPTPRKDIRDRLRAENFRSPPLESKF